MNRRPLIPDALKAVLDFMPKHRPLMVCALLLLTASAALAQPGEARFPDYQTYRPVVEATRIDAQSAPTIDGKLDEDVWASATVISDFYQIEPSVGEAKVATRIYLAHDERALYIAMEAFDDNPEDIYASILQRDGAVERDDIIRVYLDPFDTGLTGFGFEVNALGTRTERIVRGSREPIDEWDTIWDAASEINDDGWSAEMEIPFRSLSFDPDTDSWGLMITRERTHASEELRWAGLSPAVNKQGFTHAGRLVQPEGIDKGLGLDVTVSSAAKWRRNWSGPRDTDLTFEPSADILYHFTPALAGLLSLNTDFSDSPLDARQVNTSRFSLFYPETRDFFLQDAATFEFAGDSFNLDPNGQPFFSRRIGIVDGQQVKMDAGLKLSGKIAGVEVGLLTARMGEGDALDAKTLSVARASYDLSRDQRIGLIGTHGDPTGANDNSLIGVDYYHQIPRMELFGGGRLHTDLFAMRSAASDHSDDDAFGARFEYHDPEWRTIFFYRRYGENFDPALGFANRVGVNQYDLRWRRRFRKGIDFFKWYQFGGHSQIFTDLDGELETHYTEIDLRAHSPADDQFNFQIIENYEFVKQPFTLPGNLIVPAGRYDNDGYRARFTATTSRPWGAEVIYEHIDFFDGTSNNYIFGLFGRPNRHFSIGGRFTRNEIRIPDGAVDIEITSIRSVFGFSPSISLETQTQYDNISESLSVFSRLRWELRPETEAFVLLGHGALIEDSDFGRNFRSVQTQAIFRIGNTFRY